MELIRVEQALEIIHQNPYKGLEEEIPAQKAIGRILMENILADRDLPPYNRATMDGIAIGHWNTEEARLDGILFAGEKLDKIPLNFSAIEIMTGAMVPPNTKTIIPKEDLKFYKKNDENWVNWKDYPIKENQFIHWQGEDAKAGECLIQKGKKLQALDISLALSVGKERLLVEKKPKIAIISTGDEIIPVGQKPENHQMRSSNAGTLAAILNDKNINSTIFHLKDDKVELNQGLKSILENFEVILISGGVSAGKKDFLPECLADNGIHPMFHKIAQKPGKPLFFGTNKEKNQWVFAFPGNPISTLLCAKIYFLPWLLKTKIFNGYCQIENPILPSNKLDLWLPILWKKDKKLGEILNHHGSGDMVSWAKAEAFIFFSSDQNKAEFPYLNL